MEITMFISSFVIGWLLWSNYLLRKDNNKKDKQISKYSDDNIIFSSELKSIMSLNKYCIERWENSVIENKAINTENLRLLTVLKGMEKK